MLRQAIETTEYIDHHAWCFVPHSFRLMLHDLHLLGLTELREVGSMHERKALMADLSDGFLCLPGGPGTFDEVFEQWTWALLGIHAKPCGFVNVSGYYDLMRQTVQNMADNGFIAQTYVDMLVYADTSAGVLDAFRTYVAPPPKWAGARR